MLRKPRWSAIAETLRSSALAALVCGICALVAPHGVEAQYFGRNKVLWERFDVAILETEHFEIHYYPPDSPAAEYVARLSERWYERLSTFFGHEFDEKKPLIIYQEHADFQQTRVTPELIGEGTGGFTESARHRIVLPLTGINADNDHVLGHELVHAFQFDIRQRAVEEGMPRSNANVPLWVVEGLAEYLTQGRHDAATAMWMRDAVASGGLPQRDKLIQRMPSPYQYGQAVWAYVAGRWGDDTVRKLYLEATVAGVDAAIESVLGMEADDFFDAFHAALASAYEPVLAARQPPAAAAHRLIGEAQTGASVNLAPSISPDGRWVAFLSTRELDLELYLADARTGAVERKLLTADTDPHYDSLSFLSSSVAWSPDSRRLAFSVFARGEQQIAIYDLDEQRVVRQIDLPGLKGKRHAAWLPNGRQLVFSAIVDGASDLYLFDLEADEVTRLTDDPYTAIQPAVSPDGRRVVFVTDRGGTTDLTLQDFGDLQLALLDVDTHEITPLPIFPRGKHIDPHFSADGRSIYFIAEPDGVSDVFRHDLESGETVRLTRVPTGVTGITESSPALSVAADGAVAFSVLEDSGWNIYRLSADAGTSVIVDDTPSIASVLPPADVAELSVVERYLRDPRSGLPPAGSIYARRDYRPRIGLSGIGPATIGVGTSRNGFEAGGAFSAYFGDMLNLHQIVATVQGGSSQGVLDFEDTFAAEAVYLNQVRRFQWGARVERVPYVNSVTFISREIVDIGGVSMPADVIERVFDTEQITEVSLIGQYPFSMSNRLEATLGVTGIEFERAVERIVLPFAAPGIVEEIELPSPSGLHLRQAAAAFVRDTSRFGPISPVSGTRLRAETRWTSGDLRFTTTRLDFRRYVLREPWTFAVRALHMGRRGADSEDSRLAPLDIGQHSLVRGYDLGSFDWSECTLVPDVATCPELDRLIGSRIAVLNFEARLALFGSEDFGLVDMPAAPMEAVFFLDVGAAWSSGESVDLTFKRNTIERVPVFSAGIGLRSVVFGALPIEIFYAKPFQRRDDAAELGIRLGVAW